MGVKEIFGFGKEVQDYAAFAEEIRNHNITLAKLNRRYEAVMQDRFMLQLNFDGDWHQVAIPSQVLEILRKTSLEDIGKEIGIVKNKIDQRIHKESDRRK